MSGHVTHLLFSRGGFLLRGSLGLGRSCFGIGSLLLLSWSFLFGRRLSSRGSGLLSRGSSFLGWRGFSSRGGLLGCRRCCSCFLGFLGLLDVFVLEAQGLEVAVDESLVSVLMKLVSQSLRTDVGEVLDLRANNSSATRAE